MISNFTKRAITGALFVAILVGCVLYNSSGSGILLTATGALTIYEFEQLINSRAEGVNVNKIITMLGGVYLFLVMMEFRIDAADPRISTPYLLLPLYLMISKLYLRETSSMLNWVYSMPSQPYIGLPSALPSVLTLHTNPEYSSVSYNPILPLSTLVFLRLDDTGAHCVDSLIDKCCLFERISPEKPWEGPIGGRIVATGTSFVPAYYFTTMPMWEWADLALVAVVFRTWDDPTESLLKRQLYVKDSGTILPGYGGMFGRFDSALMTTPVAVFYLYVLTWF